MNLMPTSYYSLEGGIVLWQVFAQLLLQDAVQYGMHMLEHGMSTEFYKRSHKPHHRFTNPRLFDAFNGSLVSERRVLLPLRSAFIALCVNCKRACLLREPACW